jgi:RimK family alpha-L-glutamate ligase
LYVQKYVSHGGRDVRVLVLGERVVGAIERDAAPGEWRTNLAQGGTARPFRPDAVLERLALSAARAVGAHWAGIDLLPTPDGPLVLEVNAVPGWKGLSAATGIDVAAQVLQELLRLARSRERS